jgi:glycosyltransferase involved in cell wall biosynthesis
MDRFGLKLGSMDKASVLMVLSNYRMAGGVEVVINNLCSGLNKIGYNVAIGAFSFDRNPPDNIEKVNLKRFRSLTSNNISKYDFDIVHSHQPQINYYSHLTPKPFIFHYHGIANRLQEINLKVSILLCRNQISRIVSDSSTALNLLTNTVGRGVFSKIPSHIVYTGVDTKYYHTNLAQPYRKGDPQLLFVGNLYPHKNVMRIIEAMPDITKLYPNVHLQIVGNGNDYQRLNYEIKKKKLEGSVELVGVAFGENLRLRYSSCDIYISASKLEAFTLPPLEAMACGKPILLSDIPAHKELIEESNAGRTFSLLDNSSIPTKIREVYDNRRILSSAARKSAEKYDWSIVCEKLARIYDKIIAQVNK